MNISFICIASTDYIKKYTNCLSSQKKYCKKNNYSHILIDDKKYISDRRDYYWKKIYEVRDILPKYDYVVLIDCDCEITDKTPPIEEILDTNSIYYVLGISKRPNSGFLIFKNDIRSMHFLKDVIDKKEKSIPEQFSSKGENGFVIWSLAENNQGTKELDLKWNCSQPEFLESAYIIHYTNKMKSMFKEES
jgi:hypothetical protein